MTTEAKKFRNSIVFVLSFTMLLWLIKALEWAVALDFGFLGILPRTLSGTMGIITAPLVHGDVLHLISNTFPLLLLGVSVFYFYDRIALEVFAWIYFMSGFWVWMAARDAYHIGASGLVYGLVAFLFFSGLFRRDTKSLTISLIVIFLYGGMLQGLFPTNERISWESHLLGALAGAFCAFFYRDVKQQMAERQRVQSTSTERIESEYPSVFTSNGRSTYADMQEAADSYPLQAGFFPMPQAEKPPAPLASPGKEEAAATTFVYEWKTRPNKTNTYFLKGSRQAPGWEKSFTGKHS
jgi:membrane associated rhomboid family serine protease